MADINSKILAEIQKKRLEQKPSWFFILQNILAWTLVVSGVVLTSLLLSTVFELILASGAIEVFPFLRNLFWHKIWQIIPVMSLLFVGLFFILDFLLIRRAPKGYRLTQQSVVIILLLVVSGLAYLFFSIGLSRPIHNFSQERIPAYASSLEKRQRLWHNPEDGAIMGKIALLDNDGFILEDIKERRWIVDISKAHFDQNVEKIVGENVLVIGEVTENMTIKAKDILPRPGMRPLPRHMRRK